TVLDSESTSPLAILGRASRTIRFHRAASGASTGVPGGIASGRCAGDDGEGSPARAAAAQVSAPMASAVTGMMRCIAYRPPVPRSHSVGGVLQAIIEGIGSGADVDPHRDLH